MRKKGAILIVSFIFCLFVVVSTILPVQAKDDDDLSFYAVASAAGAYYDETQVADSEKKFNDAYVSMGNAGGLLGFIDTNKIKFFGWVTSFSSSTSQTYNYSSFKGGEYEGLLCYAEYGYALQSLGLDETGSGVMAIGRFVAGTVMMVAYTVSTSVESLMAIVLYVLKILNPFALFKNAVALGNLNNYLPDDAYSRTTLAAFVGTLYTKLSNLSWSMVIPSFMATTALSILLLKVTSKRDDNTFSKLKRMGIRILFVGIGVPLLGSLYTASLDSMIDYVQDSGPIGNRIIYSNYIDFQAWVQSNRLALPSGTVIDLASPTTLIAGNIDYNQTTPVRLLCYDINSVSGVTPSGSSINSDWTANYGADYNANVLGGTSSSIDWTRSLIPAYSLLWRYMSCDTYTAGDFETYWKSKNNSAESVEWIRNTQDVSAYEDSTEGLFKSDGTYSSYMQDSGGVIATYGVNTSDGLMHFKYQASGSGNGLSTLAMYNYLTTTFHKANIEINSKNNVANPYVASRHYAVNAVGGKHIVLLYWLNGIVLMFVVTVLGWGFAFCMMLGNVRRTIKLITNIPFAMLGNIKTISRVVSYTLAMIIEIVGTMFVYTLVCEILIWLNNLVETSMAKALIEGSIALPAMVIEILIASVAVVMNIWFTISALRVRKNIVKGFDEMMEEVVARMFDVERTPETPSTNLPQQAAGALAQGAGLAAGNALTGLIAGGGESGTPRADGNGNNIVNGGTGGNGNSVAGNGNGGVNLEKNTQLPNGKQANAGGQPPEKGNGGAVNPSGGSPQQLTSTGAAIGDFDRQSGKQNGGTPTTDSIIKDGESVVNNGSLDDNVAQSTVNNNTATENKLPDVSQTDVQTDVNNKQDVNSKQAVQNVGSAVSNAANTVTNATQTVTKAKAGDFVGATQSAVGTYNGAISTINDVTSVVNTINPMQAQQLQQQGQPSTTPTAPPSTQAKSQVQPQRQASTVQTTVKSQPTTTPTTQPKSQAQPKVTPPKNLPKYPYPEKVHFL